MAEINLEDSVLKLTLGDIVQSFTEQELQNQMPIFMQDIDVDTKPLVDTYQSYIANGDFAGAESYLAANPELETRIWNAYKANALLAYAAYSYLYAKDKKQQCIISQTEPSVFSETTGVGCVEGDIWFKIDSTVDGLVNTTPYMLDASGNWVEFTVSPKLEFATTEDINSLTDTAIENLRDPNGLISLKRLKEYDTKTVASLNTTVEELQEDMTNLSNTVQNTLGDQVTYELIGTDLYITRK